MSSPSITADKTPWYQWDTGLTVTVSGGEMNECHFANRKQGSAYVQAVINCVARVPDELLQVSAPIKAYGYVSDGAGGQTYVEQSFEVIARNIPADYTYTKTAQKTIRDAEAARDEAVQAAKDAKASELAADDSSVEASTSAQSASESASAAATSASNAAKSAGEAAKSASDAKNAASKTVEDASELLKTYTDNAANSASNSADFASAASGSASAAEQSATDASNAKVAAQTAKNEAATSASNAASSATAAAKSASDAAASVGAINVIAPKTVDVAASSEIDGSVAVGAGSVANKLNEFSIGNDTMTREITHVSTPTADTSASTKKYTDDNDAKTLSEAKKYTDENTSNALVGTVSGKLLHVEDAWPGKPLGLTIDGAYKQDGTPSPESPVPIVVVENPVLTVTGRNLLDTDKGLNNCFVKNSDGTYTLTKVSNSERFSENIPFKVQKGSKIYISDAHGKEKLDGKISVLVHYTDNTTRTFGFYPHDISPFFAEKETNTIKFYVEGAVAIGVSFTFIPQIEYGTEATAYKPYVGASLPITLPVDHPYLAALPDGTHDEILIDTDGNASLIASVGKTQNAAAEGVNATVGTDALSSTGALDDGSTVYYKLATSVTYNLGKLDIPSLPETISNVWTEAELTTNMSMTYKRDINIAFDNLVQAVVAAAAGE